MGYRTRNITFKERLLLFKGHGTRNITFEARFFFSPYRTRKITFKVGLFGIWLIERGILHLKRACFDL